MSAPIELRRVEAVVAPRNRSSGVRVGGRIIAGLRLTGGETARKRLGATALAAQPARSRKAIKIIHETRQNIDIAKKPIDAAAQAEPPKKEAVRAKSRVKECGYAELCTSHKPGPS